MTSPLNINWHGIDTLLLDMDGTLLDLNFDNQFWTQIIPKHYSANNGLSFDDAWEYILHHIKDIRGTLEVYNVEHWQQFLGFDIMTVKHEAAHLIQLRPGVAEFLEQMSRLGKTLILATNAHTQTIPMKLEKVGIGNYFDSIASSSTLGLAKEDPVYWQSLQQLSGFDQRRTLLIDDNVDVLRSAKHFGLAHLLTIEQPDLQKGKQEGNEFPALSHFNQITPVTL